MRTYTQLAFSGGDHGVTAVFLSLVSGALHSSTRSAKLNRKPEAVAPSAVRAERCAVGGATGGTSGRRPDSGWALRPAPLVGDMSRQGVELSAVVFSPW